MGRGWQAVRERRLWGRVQLGEPTALQGRSSQSCGVVPVLAIM